MKINRIMLITFILLFLIIYTKGINTAKSDGIHMLKIVAFGDSITLGSSLPEEVKNWTEILSEKYETEIINAGIAGNSSSQGLERIEKDVLSYKPDYVIINFGMNDSVIDGTSFNTAEQFKRNITEIVESVRRNGATPILVTPNYIIEGNETSYYYSRHNKNVFANFGGAQAFLDTYVQVIREVAVQTVTPIADVHKACDNYDAYEFLVTLRNSKVDDGVHPSEFGANIYAKVIGDCLDAQLTPLLN